MTTRDKDWKSPDSAPAVDALDAHRDPITGAPGSHPLGTGVGAVGGGVAGAAAGGLIASAAAGAAIGSFVPGAGTIVGAVTGTVIGAVAGGLAGKGVAEAVNPTAEDAYWRENFKTRPYVEPGRKYDDYRPAYEYGWQSRGRYAGKKFEDVESSLRREWEEKYGDKTASDDYSWAKIRSATRDAWDRVESGGTAPGSATDTPKTTRPASGTAAASAAAGAVPADAGFEMKERVAPASDDWTDHPIGTAVGGVAGATAGAAAGAVLGSAVLPGPGSVLGGIAGAVAGAAGGGAIGHEAAAAVNPADISEETYWRNTSPTRPYYAGDYAFDDDYLPAYRYGWQSQRRLAGKRFDDAEPDLRRDWDTFKGKSRLAWDRARDAARDAWTRVEGR